MAAINWTTTQTALDAAIAVPADGPDLTLLQDVRRRLTRVGEGYDALWAATAGVDDAKTAAIAAVADAFTEWAIATYEPQASLNTTGDSRSTKGLARRGQGRGRC